MKQIAILGVVAIAILATGAKRSGKPYFAQWDTPFGVPPFDKIKLKHYRSAFDKGMELQKGEVDAIVKDRSAPTFQNTVEALERSGSMLDRVANVFFAMRSSMTNDKTGR